MRYLIVAILCLCGTSADAEAIFPTAVSDKYASEKPDKARQRTCLDQYMANKATDSNGGLRPVEIHREFITAAARWMIAAKL